MQVDSEYWRLLQCNLIKSQIRQIGCVERSRRVCCKWSMVQMFQASATYNSELQYSANCSRFDKFSDFTQQSVFGNLKQSWNIPKKHENLGQLFETKIQRIF